jgi:predicted aspartyl protease
MGIFRTTVEIAATHPPIAVTSIDAVMVDTGSEYSWFPAPVLDALGIARIKPLRFVAADGRVIERPTGYAFISVAGERSPTIVVFAEPEDQTLLGAHALEGMNLRVDLVNRVLVPAGPVPAAAA